MNYTEQFFKFPIRIYDEVDAVNAALREGKRIEEEQEMKAIDIEYVVGVKALRPDDIYSWGDGYDTEHPQEVRDTGFPLTVVFDEKGGAWECIWPRKKFEQKLDEFVKKLEESIEK